VISFAFFPFAVINFDSS
jgi:hypothetical protein